MAESLGTAKLTLAVDDQQFQAGMAGIKQKAEGGAKAVDSITNAVRGLVPQLTALGTAAFVFDQIKKADEAGAAVRTLGVDSAELSKRLDLLSASLDGNYSKVELLKAAYDVASSGFASAADTTNVLRGAALAATGGFTDLETASDGITTVLNAYGMSSSRATELADKFIQTQNDGKITVAQYGHEIGSVASVAATANISIDELNAAIGASTAKTGQVAQTFTGLRQVISSILKPSSEATQLASSLGIQYNLAGLKAKGFAGLLTEIAQKTGGAADKIAVLTGSVEAQAAIQPLLNDQLASYNKALENQKNSAGQAAMASRENSNTITGGINQIGNEFSNLATSLDKTLAPVFKGIIKDLDNVLKKLIQVNNLNPKTVADAENKAFAAVESQSGALQRTGFFGKLSVNYGGKKFEGSATGIADEITRYILQAAIEKQVSATDATNGATAGAKPTPKPTEPPPPPPPDLSTLGGLQARISALQEANKKLKFDSNDYLENTREIKDLEGTLANATYDRAKAQNSIVSASREELLAATELVGMHGAELTIAQSRVGIAEKIRAVAAAERSLGAARSGNDWAKIDAASVTLGDAGDKLRTALIKGSDAAKQSLKEAATGLTDAFKSLQSARQNAYDLLPDYRQEQLRRQAESSINKGINSGELDRFKVDAALGPGFYRNADPQKLFGIAGQSDAIAQAQKALTLATLDQTKAQVEATKITAEFNKASATLVGVLVNAILYRQPPQAYLQ